MQMFIIVKHLLSNCPFISASSFSAIYHLAADLSVLRRCCVICNHVKVRFGVLKALCDNHWLS